MILITVGSDSLVVSRNDSTPAPRSPNRHGKIGFVGIGTVESRWPDPALSRHSPPQASVKKSSRTPRGFNNYRFLTEGSVEWPRIYSTDESVFVNLHLKRFLRFRWNRKLGFEMKFTRGFFFFFTNYDRSSEHKSRWSIHSNMLHTDFDYIVMASVPTDYTSVISTLTMTIDETGL